MKCLTTKSIKFVSTLICAATCVGCSTAKIENPVNVPSSTDDPIKTPEPPVVRGKHLSPDDFMEFKSYLQSDLFYDLRNRMAIDIVYQKSKVKVFGKYYRWANEYWINPRRVEKNFRKDACHMEMCYRMEPIISQAGPLSQARQWAVLNFDKFTLGMYFDSEDKYLEFLSGTEDCTFQYPCHVWAVGDLQNTMATRKGENIRLAYVSVQHIFIIKRGNDQIIETIKELGQKGWDFATVATKLVSLF